MPTLQLLLTLTAFACLFVMTGLLVQGFRKGSYSAFFWFCVAFMLFLNTGYFIHGIPESISVFVGLFDPLMNLGLDTLTNGELQKLVHDVLAVVIEVWEAGGLRDPHIRESSIQS